MKYLSEKEQRAKKLEVFEIDDMKDGTDSNNKKQTPADKTGVSNIFCFLIIDVV